MSDMSNSANLRFLVVQEGGSSGEFYLHTFASEAAAVAFRLSAAHASYRTTPPIALPEGGVNQQMLDLLETLVAQVATKMEYAQGQPKVRLTRPAPEEGEMVHLRFHPQAWQNDYAIPVDAKGPVECWVPRDAVGAVPEDFSDEADELRYLAGIPAWWREWDGPFEVSIANRDELELPSSSPVPRG